MKVWTNGACDVIWDEEGLLVRRGPESNRYALPYSPAFELFEHSSLYVTPSAKRAVPTSAMVGHLGYGHGPLECDLLTGAATPLEFFVDRAYVDDNEVLLESLHVQFSGEPKVMTSTPRLGFAPFGEDERVTGDYASRPPGLPLPGEVKAAWPANAEGSFWTQLPWSEKGWSNSFVLSASPEGWTGTDKNTGLLVRISKDRQPRHVLRV